MKVVNIDVQSHLVEKLENLDALSFVLDVVRPLGHKALRIEPFTGSLLSVKLPLAPIRKFEDEDYSNVFNLVHTIPIYLRSCRPEVYDKERDIVESLGAYFPNAKGDSPYIELYLRAIEVESAGKDETHFKWLFAVVLLHELAHAALDIFNSESCSNNMEKVFYCTEFGRWREESMANATALRIIEEYGDNGFYEFAKEFMLGQPDEYALGVMMENFDNGDFRSVMMGKERGVDAALQARWMAQARNWAKMKGWDKDDHYRIMRTVSERKNKKLMKDWNYWLTSQYVYEYKGQYYTNEQELVPCVVEHILDEYEEKNGKKMSVEEFGETFQYIATGAGMSYEPAADVCHDSRYKTKFQLLDGELALYYWWDNRTVHRFIDFGAHGIVEYCNNA